MNVYERMFELLLEGVTTGGDAYETGKRVGRFSISPKAFKINNKVNFSRQDRTHDAKERIRSRLEKRGKSATEFSKGVIAGGQDSMRQRKKRKTAFIKANQKHKGKREN